MAITITGNSTDQTIMLIYGKESSRTENYAVMAVRETGKTFRTEEGHVDDMFEREKTIEEDRADTKNERRCIWATFLLFAVLDILLIIKKAELLTLIGFIVFETGSFIPVATILNIFCNNFKTEAMRNDFKKCHGAEHKLINCFTKLNRLPSADEIKKASRIHRECGCVTAGNHLMFFAALGSAVVFYPQIGTMNSILIVLLVFLLLLFVTSFGINPWMLLEYFNTEEPGETELEMASEALLLLLNRLNEDVCVMPGEDRELINNLLDEKKQRSEP